MSQKKDFKNNKSVKTDENNSKIDENVKIEENNEEKSYIQEKILENWEINWEINKEEKVDKVSAVLWFFKDLVSIIIIVFVIKTFFIVPFVINGQSMYDSYYDKEFIIVDKISYLLGSPDRWDVIVFRPWVDENKEYFLKRIIWIPWDTLKIKDWKVFIKEKWKTEFVELQETYLSEDNLSSTFVWTSTNLEKVYTLSDDSYFVMWDNRKHSTDSRECFSNCLARSEFVKKEDMIWKILIDLWYVNIKKLNFIHPNLWIETFPRFFSSPSTFDYKELD